MKKLSYKIPEEAIDTMTARERLMIYGASTVSNDDFIATARQLLQDKIQIVKIIRGGLPNTFFGQLLDHLPLTEDRWAEIFNISIKSLRRYQDGEHTFKPIHTEKLVAMTEVTLQGLETFGSHSKFHLWLDTPSAIFSGMAPVELLADSYGKDLVLAELIRIDHGLFS